MRWLDVRYLFLDAYSTPWWEFLVGLGLLVLAAGTLLWLAGCVRVAWIGRPLAAIPLACGGLTLSSSAVLVPIGWALCTMPVHRKLFGMPFFTPDLFSFPDDALGWIPLGLALGVMGVGLMAIRKRPPGG
jgi:hypothetical protein